MCMFVSFEHYNNSSHDTGMEISIENIKFSKHKNHVEVVTKFCKIRQQLFNKTTS